MKIASTASRLTSTYTAGLSRRSFRGCVFARKRDNAVRVAMTILFSDLLLFPLVKNALLTKLSTLGNNPKWASMLAT